MTHIKDYFPELVGPEKVYLQEIMAGMYQDQAHLFCLEYRRKRKDPQTVLLAAIVGLCVCPGFQRFYLGETGVGLLFLFTIGLLEMGSIADVVTYKTLALSHNKRLAHDLLRETRTFTGRESARPIDEYTTSLPCQSSGMVTS